LPALPLPLILLSAMMRSYPDDARLAARARDRVTVMASDDTECSTRDVVPSRRAGVSKSCIGRAGEPEECIREMRRAQGAPPLGHGRRAWIAGSLPCAPGLG